MSVVTNLEFETSYIIVHRDSGPPTRYSIADVLAAADIPTGLTYSQVSAVTALANLVAVLLRTLIDNGTLGDTFLEDGDYNLEDLVEAIENMGGDYGEPDLTGSED